ncbi:hypothetical protein IC229_13640 [Spirosoma sp. BT702]|uniref:TonB C-terminal domain-containing protein n=1 Tax=Spirosoma profusum TaxID=2771354 RepID=A0A926Y1A5_9BACT|nr:hypothetical protein [Spirosoma profusum]MBD2701688.1 hypothetical protein [Spirosoma profusum]
MKKSFALLMLVGFLATQAYAAPHKPKVAKATLEQQVGKYVSYPDALKPTQKGGIVVVQFRVNSSSEICQVAVFSHNEQLNSEITRQLTGAKVEGYQTDLSEFVQQVHTVRLRFKA